MPSSSPPERVQEPLCVADFHSKSWITLLSDERRTSTSECRVRPNRRSVFCQPGRSSLPSGPFGDGARHRRSRASGQLTQKLRVRVVLFLLFSLQFRFLDTDPHNRGGRPATHAYPRSSSCYAAAMITSRLNP